MIRNKEIKTFILNFKCLVNLSANSISTTSIPINIKVKNTPKSSTPVIKKRMSIHAVKTRAIFSDSSNFYPPIFRSNVIFFLSIFVSFILIFFFVARVIAVSAALHVGQGYCLQTF